MKATPLTLYFLDYGNLKAYLAATVFVAGNIVLPQLAVLPAILLKSALLAVANYFKRISIPILFGVVFAYQLVGTLGEWALTDFHTAVQDFRIAIPGMLLQVFGGYALIRYIICK